MWTFLFPARESPACLGASQLGWGLYVDPESSRRVCGVLLQKAPPGGSLE